MTEDTLYSTGAITEDFSFNDRVAEVFDDMLDRFDGRSGYSGCCQCS